MASTDRQNGRESNLTSLEQPSSPIVYDLRQELRVAAHSHELHEVEDEEDLIFDENDKIRILDAGHGGEGWWRGQNVRTGEIGNFPSTYLKPVQKIDKWMARLQGISDTRTTSAGAVLEGTETVVTSSQHHSEVTRINSLYQTRKPNYRCYESSTYDPSFFFNRFNNMHYHFITTTIDMYPEAGFFLLFVCISASCLVLISILWWLVHGADNGSDVQDSSIEYDEAASSTFGIEEAFLFVFSVFLAGEYDPTYLDRSNKRGVIGVFVLTMAAGVLIVSCLIAILNEFFMDLAKRVECGTSHVVESKHTVILGYNDTTARVCLQIAYIQQDAENRLKHLYGIFARMAILLLGKNMCFKILLPNTSLLGKVVILANNGDRQSIVNEIFRVLSEHGIQYSQARRLFCVRIGDTCTPNELYRVSTQRASSILVSCTKGDEEEYEISHGKVHNGTTLRTLLALRSLFFNYKTASDVKYNFPEKLKIVVQCGSEHTCLDAASFVSPHDEMNVISYVNTSMLNNKLLFRCATSPGLSRIFLDELLNFNGSALRCVQAEHLPLPKGMRDTLNKSGLPWRNLLRETRWDDAVLVGVVANHGPRAAPYSKDRDDDIIPNLSQTDVGGLCPSPDFIIRPSTEVIFVSRNLVPSLADNAASFKVASSRDLTQSTSILEMSDEDDAVQSETNVIVCGWKKKWRDSTGRKEFGKRLDELASDLPKNAVIVFMNDLSPEAFEKTCSVLKRFVAIAATPTLKRKKVEIKSWQYEPAEGKQIIITHVNGDPSNHDDIRETFLPLHKQMPFKTAIVFSESNLDRQSQSSHDTRTLSTLLLLRYYTRRLTVEHQNIHCVAETFFDLTANLAAGPIADSWQQNHNIQVHDFILTQKLTARALTTALAFPHMQEHISELFQPAKTVVQHSPEIHLLPFKGTGPNNPTFGEIADFVSNTFANWAIAIGIADVNQVGEIRLAPSPTEKVHIFAHLYR